jgi:hypothetical protein
MQSIKEPVDEKSPTVTGTTPSSEEAEMLENFPL